MSGCYPSLEDQGNTHFCIGCAKMVEECICIWGKFRELYAIFSTLEQKVDKHWDINYQSDENLSKRIIEAASNNLVSRLAHLEKKFDNLEGLEEKLKKLESSVASLHSFELSICKEPHPRILKERIEELERFQDIAHLEYQQRKKTPHKCPVCDGKYIAMFKDCECACLACDKGIVWG